MPGKPFVQTLVDSLPEGFEKRAFVPGALKNLGKGAWNLAFGGVTHELANGVKKWDPLHGLKNVGIVHDTHMDGPLKGMIKHDAVTGAPVMKKRGLLSYVSQEFKGPKPTRADLYAHQAADKAGMNVGRFMQQASPDQIKEMGNINQMGSLDFMKSHPGLAANWYGRNALHKGFFVGLPAWEMGGVLSGKEPINPGEGPVGNIGQSLGSAVGMVAGMPLGLVGGGAAASALGSAGQSLGHRADKFLGLRPMGEGHPLPPPPPALTPAVPQPGQSWPYAR